MVKMIAEKVSAWRRYRISVRELSRLTDRELNELGLSRFDRPDPGSCESRRVSIGFPLLHVCPVQSDLPWPMCFV